MKDAVHEVSDDQRVRARKIRERVGQRLDAQQLGENRLPGTPRYVLDSGHVERRTSWICGIGDQAEESEIGTEFEAATVTRIPFIEDRNSRRGARRGAAIARDLDWL